MLARKLLQQYLIEALIYGTVAAIVWRLAGLRPVLAVTLAISLFFGLRALFVLITFHQAETVAPTRPKTLRVGFAGGAMMLFAEWIALVRAFVWLAPMQRMLSPNDPPPGLPHFGPPVLLVHGFFGNGGYWQPLREALKRRGMGRVYTLNLEPLGADIDQYASQLAKRIEEICLACRNRRIILVGYSLGGTVARYYIQRLDRAERVAKLITIGTPHHGTAFANRRFLTARNVRQLRPGSQWLAQLNLSELGSPSLPIVSIYSLHDNIIVPQDSASLAYASNRAISGIGHMQLLFSPMVQAWVYDEIDAAMPGPR